MVFIIKTLFNIWKGFLNMASMNEKKLIIGTHDGVFHCDEVLACFLLKLLPEYKNAEIIRTREKEKLDLCDIVVDVGGEYIPEKNRFDHHQRAFNHTFSTVRPELSTKKTIKLSSAGLIYAHFGIEIIQEVLRLLNVHYPLRDVKQILLTVYDNLIEEIDGIDNGVPMTDDGTLKYHIHTHLSARVHRLNPTWNELAEVNITERFEKAMALVGEEFIDTVKRTAIVWLPTRDLVRKAIEDRKSVYPSGEIVQFEEQCPWKQHLFDIEEELNIKGEIKFVIYHESLKDSWRVQGIPIEPGSFICRVFLRKEWQGVRDENLCAVSGIPNSIFCHATGFIGGNKTKEGALQMALTSLEAHKENL